MANFTKIVDKALPANARYIVVKDQDLATGDIIRAYDSLGRNADTLTVEVAAAGVFAIRVNPKVKVYPRRQHPSSEPFSWAENGEIYVASGVELDTGVDTIVIASGDAAEVHFQMNDMPINNLQVIFSGDFELTLS